MQTTVCVGLLKEVISEPVPLSVYTLLSTPWSDSATQWAITTILAGSTIVDLWVARLRERSSGSRDEDRAAPHQVK